MAATADFESFEALLAYCRDNNCTIADAVIAGETAESGDSREVILAKVATLAEQMRVTIASGVQSEEKSLSGLTGGDAKKIMDFMKKDTCFLSPLEMRMIAYGLATLEENSRMKKIVACPTAGAAGSVPAALIALEHEKKLPPERTVMGLLTAGCIGNIVSRRMFLSGSAAGCQAEVGVASGMAAGGLVEALGGTPEEILEAAAISMQNLMGLICDPVAGLVEVPCVVRNGLSGIQAAASATMALAGVRSFVPIDEVVDAMAEVGRTMSPRYKESAEGGLAQTPTAIKFTHRFLPPS